ncbi:hypothetical protein KXT86_27005, partial [Salmonella enterica subsp. enterica serovar Weltevreden]|nr:hypothetical protein [Salmonella enterica subsp. enterica serovar Weltevreden]
VWLHRLSHVSSGLALVIVQMNRVRQLQLVVAVNHNLLQHFLQNTSAATIPAPEQQWMLQPIRSRQQITMRLSLLILFIFGAHAEMV